MIVQYKNATNILVQKNTVGAKGMLHME